MEKQIINRRTATKLTLAAGLAVAAAPRFVFAKDYKKPVPEAMGLTAYLKDGQVHLRWNNMPLTAYRAKSSQKYPYFYPLNGLASGTSVTTESALPIRITAGCGWDANPSTEGITGLTTGLNPVRSSQKNWNSEKLPTGR